MFVCFLLSICPIFNRFSYLSAYLNRFHVVSPVPACWHPVPPGTGCHQTRAVTRPGQHVVAPGAYWHHMLPRCASVHPQLLYIYSDTVIYVENISQWLYNEHSGQWVYEHSDTVTVWWQNVALFALSPPPSLKAYCIRCLKLFYLYRIKHGGI